MKPLYFNDPVVMQDGDIKKLSELGGGSSYSSEEQVIGTWADGHKLYRRLISTRTPNTENVNTVVADGGDGVDIKNLNGVVTSASNGKIPLNYYYSANAYILTAVNASSQLVMNVGGSGFVSRPCDIIIEYTKSNSEDNSTSDTSVIS